MKRIRLGICMNDGQYEERLGKFLMSHYTEQMELFMYTNIEQILKEDTVTLDVLLLSDQMDLLRYCCQLQELEGVVLISLADNPQHCENSGELSGERVLFVDKYQNVSRLVDEIIRSAAVEEQILRSEPKPETVGIYAVYSLCRSEFQLPFALAAGAVFGEQGKVLLIDLQENSGVSGLLEGKKDSGLEELIVMTALGRFSGKRVRSCIAHLDPVDLVYPIRSSENICGVEKDTYLKLIRMIQQEMDYNMIVVNLGSRFSGFFEFMDQCRKVYLLTERKGPGKYREKEFLTELEEQGYPSMRQQLTAIELPAEDVQESSCVNLAEKWKWTEVGKWIREDMQEREYPQKDRMAAEWK